MTRAAELPTFAPSTLAAVVWLICWRPDRLRRFLDHYHPHSALLEQTARFTIRKHNNNKTWRPK
jgi:hypothetical protein